MKRITGELYTLTMTSRLLEHADPDALTAHRGAGTVHANLPEVRECEFDSESKPNAINSESASSCARQASRKLCRYSGRVGVHTVVLYHNCVWPISFEGFHGL